MQPEKWQALQRIELQLREHDFPPQLVVESTARCNFRCRHCHHHELRRKQGTMSDELWTKIITEAVACKPDTEVWPTFYGEALLLGRIIYRRIRQARGLGLTNLVLNSNGSFCRDGNNEEILTCGLRRFIVSLDGFTPETFEKIRFTRDPHGKRAPVYAGVRALLERKRELDAQGAATPTIICQFSRMDENEHEAEAFRDYWLSLGAHVKLREKFTWTGFVAAPNLTPPAPANSRCPTDVGRSTTPADSRCPRIACPWGNNTCAIHWNGDVVACAVDSEGGFVAGNVGHRLIAGAPTSVAEIWQGPLRRFREAHRRHVWDDLPVLCQNCVDWQAVGASSYTPDGQVYHSVAATS